MQTISDRQSKPSERPIVVSATQARQGVTGHNVRYVFAISLAAAVVALTVVFLFFFAGS